MQSQGFVPNKEASICKSFSTEMEQRVAETGMHILGLYGQLTITGTRIKKTVQQRTLPYFHRNDDTPEARGFIKNNFVTGFNGHEFFFGTAAGREGLINTAITTAKTGYIQRRLVKSLEDMSVMLKILVLIL